MEAIPTCQLVMTNATGSNEIHYVASGYGKPLKKKESMMQLTDHKDGKCLVYCCVAIGGVEGVNSTLWHFQPHQPQLTAVPEWVSRGNTLSSFRISSQNACVDLSVTGSRTTWKEKRKSVCSLMCTCALGFPLHPSQLPWVEQHTLCTCEFANICMFIWSSAL